jgi:4-amino-4-deoxy-L-arabinose transferase-like glycosyltransferase
LVGLSLQSLRLVNIAVSLAAVFVFYGLVARTVTRREALLFALLFGLSPYFFGASFLALTDNIGILFALLAVRALYRSWESGAARHWVAACAWICLATLTRQLYVWLAFGAVLTLLVRGQALRSAALKTAGLVVACLPLAALVLVWGGLTPPSFQQEHVSSSTINPRAGVFGIALVGLYWAALFPDRVLAVLRGLRGSRFMPLAMLAAAGAIVLLVIPTLASEGDDGILWRLSRMSPQMLGSGLIFWILFPLGLLFFWNALRAQDPASTRLALMALFFLICNLPNAKVFQKYYDPLTIAFVVLIETRAPSSAALAKLSRPLLLLAFAAYPFISWWLVSSA